MEDKPISSWEAQNEAEMMNALDVLYEMSIGYLLSELRDEHPLVYQKVISQVRFRSQLTNNVRFSIDSMLADLVKEYSEKLEPGTL